MEKESNVDVIVSPWLVPLLHSLSICFHEGCWVHVSIVYLLLKASHWKETPICQSAVSLDGGLAICAAV